RRVCLDLERAICQPAAFTSFVRAGDGDAGGSYGVAQCRDRGLGVGLGFSDQAQLHDFDHGWASYFLRQAAYRSLSNTPRIIWRTSSPVRTVFSKSASATALTAGQCDSMRYCVFCTNDRISGSSLSALTSATEMPSRAAR